jgi:hypothetical protein
MHFLEENLRERWWGRDGKLMTGGGENGIYFAASFLDPRLCRRDNFSTEDRVFMNKCLEKLINKDVCLDRILAFLRSEAE